MLEIGVELGVFLTGDAADEPSIDVEPLVQALEQFFSARVFRAIG
jgi:hypothetical protein